MTDAAAPPAIVRPLIDVDSIDAHGHLLARGLRTGGRGAGAIDLVASSGGSTPSCTSVPVHRHCSHSDFLRARAAGGDVQRRIHQLLIEPENPRQGLFEHDEYLNVRRSLRCGSGCPRFADAERTESRSFPNSGPADLGTAGDAMRTSGASVPSERSGVSGP